MLGRKNGKANVGSGVLTLTLNAVWENNLVDSGSGFKNAHRRPARSSSQLPPLPPSIKVDRRERTVFFKNGRLFFPRVPHSNRKLPTLNGGARGRNGRPEICGWAFFNPEPVLKRCRKLVTAISKMSPTMAQQPELFGPHTKTRPARLGHEWVGGDSFGTLLGFLFLQCATLAW